MQRLWSPWRSVHLNAETRDTGDDDRSVFCRIAAEDRDEENLVVWRGESVFVVMNLYPYNNGHLMIVPFREVADYTDLTSAEQQEIARVTDRCLRWLRAALDPDGFNVGMNLGDAAGAGIPRHLHVHIVPRWRGDTNFMPTLAEVKVIPEALRDTYDRIREAVAAEGQNLG
jgi:ATP adenylyltransferase